MAPHRLSFMASFFKVLYNISAATCV